MSNRISKASSLVLLEIEDKFSKSNKNKTIAKSCLRLCSEWALVKESALEDFSKRQAKKSCRKYVKENLKEEVAGSALVSILFSVIVKLIIEWVIENYVRNLLKK
tara:strand:- start:50 stop:364 length:315 start_codon:yes stop_codon:yes gene_type:complete